MGLITREQESCTQELRRLVGKGGYAGAMLTLRDGRPFAQEVRRDVDSGKFAAMSSSLVALGDTVLRELSAGALDHVLVDGAGGKLVITKAPDCSGMLILAVLTLGDMRLGLALGQVEACAVLISDILRPRLAANRD